MVVEICDVVVREVVVSSMLVVAGVVTVVTFVVTSVVVNSESSEYFAHWCQWVILLVERQARDRTVPG